MLTSVSTSAKKEQASIGSLDGERGECMKRCWKKKKARHGESSKFTVAGCSGVQSAVCALGQHMNLMPLEIFCAGGRFCHSLLLAFMHLCSVLIFWVFFFVVDMHLVRCLKKDILLPCCPQSSLHTPDFQVDLQFVLIGTNRINLTVAKMFARHSQPVLMAAKSFSCGYQILNMF